MEFYTPSNSLSYIFSVISILKYKLLQTSTKRDTLKKQKHLLSATRCVSSVVNKIVTVLQIIGISILFDFMREENHIPQLCS